MNSPLLNQELVNMEQRQVREQFHRTSIATTDHRSRLERVLTILRSSVVRFDRRIAQRPVPRSEASEDLATLA